MSGSIERAVRYFAGVPLSPSASVGLLHEGERDFLSGAELARAVVGGHCRDCVVGVDPVDAGILEHFHQRFAAGEFDLCCDFLRRGWKLGGFRFQAFFRLRFEEAGVGKRRGPGFVRCVRRFFCCGLCGGHDGGEGETGVFFRGLTEAVDACRLRFHRAPVDQATTRGARSAVSDAVAIPS